MELGCESTYTARVKHLGIQLGSGRSVEVESMDGGGNCTVDTAGVRSLCRAGLRFGR